MKKKINLLSKQKKYIKLEKVFQVLRVCVLVSGIIVFLLDIIFFSLLLQQKQQLDSLTAEKNKLLEFMVANRKEETSFAYFRNKQKQIASYLKNDVNFFPYYNLLNESLKSSSPEAALDSVVIDKTKDVDFTVVFADFTSLLSFFKFAESDSFLKNFTNLNLKGFDIRTKENKNYKLSFKGSFKDIK